MKKCTKCHQLKPKEDFYKQKYGKDFLRASCKLCCNADSKLWFDNNFIKDGEKGKEWYKDNKNKRIKSINKWIKNNAHKRQAQEQVHRSIASGKLIRKPCAVCNNTKTDAHHPDYSKPLEVIFLCRKHHIEIHRKERLKK